jgi:sirohydrochlorin cobaltochelatase
MQIGRHSFLPSIGVVSRESGMMSKIGVMVCGHGSRDDEAIAEFAAVAAGIARRLPQYPVASGFLEFAQPIIRDGLDKLRAGGVERILAIPGMLFAAGHVKNDIPSVLNDYTAQYPRIRIDYGRDLDVDVRLLRVAQARIEQAERVSSRQVPREEALLMVVGRGTSDPDANSNTARSRACCGRAWASAGARSATAA